MGRIISSLNDVRKLLTELEEYIVSIIQDNLEQVHLEYYEKMALIDLKDVGLFSTNCYLHIVGK